MMDFSLKGPLGCTYYIVYAGDINTLRQGYTMRRL